MRDAYSKNQAQVRTLNLWARSGVCPPADLQPGVDVILEVSLSDAVMLRTGVALDDYLGSDARDCVDVECRERYRAWRTRHRPALTVEGIDLAFVWEVELIAQCFLPAACLRHGLPEVFESARCSRVVTRLAEPGIARLVAAIAAWHGVEALSPCEGVAEREPLRRAPSPIGSTAARLGVRPYVRGEVLTLAYWNTLPLLSELAWRRRGPRIVSCPLPVRNIAGARAVSLAVRGGWTGMPGPRVLARSRAMLMARYRAISEAESSDPFDAALDSYALEVLQRISLDTLANVEHVRRALSCGRVRLGLFPFDGAEQARMLIPALRETGAKTLVAQHGFSGRLGDPEMLVADHLAVWSEHDRSYPDGRPQDTITVTGNPGVTHLAGMAALRRKRCGRSVVLVDYAGRLSVRIDARINRRHVEVALRALAAVRPGSSVVIRPHPSDLAPVGYVALAGACPELSVEVDGRSPIEALLADVDLCVGGVSTATLQACALGVPTVALDVAAIERPWPFHAGALPTVSDCDSLVEAIAALLHTGEVAGREDALNALGVRGDAIERVIELIARLSR
jgi:hypothetical protein